MSRPVNWSPLADSDPVPGDEAELRGMARRYRDFAAELEEQAATLNRLSQAEGWDACAGRAFASTAGEVGEQIQKAKGRYQAVGDALNTYVTILVQSQGEADAALRQAQQLQAQAQADAQAHEQAEKAAQASPGPDIVPKAPPSADEVLAGPRAQLQHAVDRRNSAARHAASTIRAATSHDGLKDSWWDKVKDWSGRQWDSFIDWVHDHAGRINWWADFLGKVSSTLAVISMVIAFIPVLDVLAPALLAVSAGLTVISLVLHTMTALSGDGSWIAVGLDVLGLVTYGWGRRAVTGARAAQAALKGAAGVAVKRAAIDSGEAAWVAGRQAAGKAVTKAGRAAARSGPLARAAKAEAKEAVAAAARGKTNPFNNLLASKLSRARPKLNKFADSKVGKVLGLDSEVLLGESERKAVAALAPTSQKVQGALEDLESKVKVSEVLDGFGLTGDIIDKSHAAGGYEDRATFGRYANQ